MDGTGSSDSKANEPVPESGMDKGLESYPDSDFKSGFHFDLYKVLDLIDLRRPLEGLIKDR